MPFTASAQAASIVLTCNILNIKYSRDKMRAITQFASADGEWGVLRFQLDTYGTNLVVTKQKKAFQRNQLIIIISQNRQPTQLWHFNFLLIFFCSYQMCCLSSIVRRCLTVIGAWRAASTAYFQKWQL